MLVLRYRTWDDVLKQGVVDADIAGRGGKIRSTKSTNQTVDAVDSSITELGLRDGSAARSCSLSTNR